MTARYIASVIMGAAEAWNSKKYYNHGDDYRWLPYAVVKKNQILLFVYRKKPFFLNLKFSNTSSHVYANTLNFYAFNVTVKMFIILNIIFNIFLLYLKYNIGHEIQ